MVCGRNDRRADRCSQQPLLRRLCRLAECPPAVRRRLLGSAVLHCSRGVFRFAGCGSCWSVRRGFEASEPLMTTRHNNLNRRQLNPPKVIGSKMTQYRFCTSLVGVANVLGCLNGCLIVALFRLWRSSASPASCWSPRSSCEDLRLLKIRTCLQSLL